MGDKSKPSDGRFSNFETDPRFRLPSKRKTKTTIDNRFSRMLDDSEFTQTSKVDRYGRKVKSDSKKKSLQRLYEPEKEDGLEVEDDDVVERELAKYDPARGGGFSSSDSDSESEDHEEEGDLEDGATDVHATSSLQRIRDEQADVETGEVTNRIAIVNFDWDRIRAADLMALFNSFVPSASGRIESVSIYPSQYGKERIQREEVEGPPKEIFRNAGQSKESDSQHDSEDSSDEDEEEDIKNELITEGNDQDFDSTAVRSYQLDRLRWYYAVVVCSDKATAQRVYEATDGTEYQSSSNFLDLRFIPDDTTFDDDEPRDVCEKVPVGYKPIEFVTDALQHSKVKLSWDLHPEEMSRNESIKRAFSGSRAEIEENDLRAYLASDTEDDDDAAMEPAAETDEPKLSKKELARRKMREALGLSDDPKPDKPKAGLVGDMQITFTPALTETDSKSGPKKSGDQGETTIEKYMRKERERKDKKREKARAKREGVESDGATNSGEEKDEGNEDLGFNDPFFTTDEPAKSAKPSARKEDRLKKRAAREAKEAEQAEQKAQLQLLMTPNDQDQVEHLEHFDMNEIVYAEKQKAKKHKKKGKRAGKERTGLQEDFKMDVGDDRFKAVFDSHEFAIDPSNPKFKATEGMKKLLEEGRKKRKAGGDVPLDDSPGKSPAQRSKKVKGGEALAGLVEVVKQKAKRKTGVE